MAPEIPAADGSSPKTQRFDGPPPMVIDPAKRYTAEMATIQGHHDHRPRRHCRARARSTTSSSWPAGTTTTGSSSTGSSRGSCSRAATPRDRGGAAPATGSTTSCPRPGRYEIGSLAMANAGPNTNGSQFFIVSGPDGAALPPSYSLFGKVVERPRRRQGHRVGRAAARGRRRSRSSSSR